MGTVPPRIVQPDLELMWTVVGCTAQEAADAMTAAFTPSWYAIWLDDGVTSERYGTSAYDTPQEAQDVCSALQETYSRYFYECRFTVRLQARELPAPRVNPQLIYKDY